MDDGERVGAEQLLAWCRRVTVNYAGVNMVDMAHSWNDGLALCAIVHYLCPDAIDFDGLSVTGNPIDNTAAALEAAWRVLGVAPALIPGSDLARSDARAPDPLAVISYVVQLYHAAHSSHCRLSPAQHSPSLAHKSVNSAHKSVNSAHKSDHSTHKSDNCAHKPDNSTHKSDNSTERETDSSHKFVHSMDQVDSSTSSDNNCAHTDSSCTSDIAHTQDRQLEDVALSAGEHRSCLNQSAATDGDNTVDQESDGASAMSCFICQSPVLYVCQRVFISQHVLVHRGCFRCVVCGCQLSRLDCATNVDHNDVTGGSRASFKCCVCFANENSFFVADTSLEPCVAENVDVHKDVGSDGISAGVEQQEKEERHEQETRQEEKEEKLQEQETRKEEKEEKLQEQETRKEEKEEKLQEQETRQEEKEDKLQEQETRQEEKEDKLQEQETLQEEKEEKLQEQETLQEEKEDKLQEQETLQGDKLEEQETRQEEKEKEERQKQETRPVKKEEKLQEEEEGQEKEKEGSQEEEEVRISPASIVQGTDSVQQDVSDVDPVRPAGDPDFVKQHTCEASPDQEPSAVDKGEPVEGLLTADRDQSSDRQTDNNEERADDGAAVEDLEAGGEERKDDHVQELDVKEDIQHDHQQSSITDSCDVRETSSQDPITVSSDGGDGGPSYPAEFNPFGDEEDIEEASTEQNFDHPNAAHLPDTCGNPFEEEEDHHDDEEVVVRSSTSPTVSPAITTKPPHTEISNPFEPPPRPPPPVVQTSPLNTPRDINKGYVQLHRSNSRTSLFSSASSSGGGRKKRLAPAPPPGGTTSPVRGASSASLVHKRAGSTRHKGPAPPLPLPAKRQVRSVSPGVLEGRLRELDMRQCSLESQTVELEEALRPHMHQHWHERGHVCYDQRVEEMFSQLFELIAERNALSRQQTELIYMRRQHRLEEEHAEIEHEIRRSLSRANALKTVEQRVREQTLIDRLVEVVEERDRVLTVIEQQRARSLARAHHTASPSDSPTPSAGGAAVTETSAKKVNTLRKKSSMIVKAIAKKTKTAAKEENVVCEETASEPTATPHKTKQHKSSRTKLKKLFAQTKNVT